jgi:RNAse (barnase) inhibitor barstar
MSAKIKNYNLGKFEKIFDQLMKKYGVQNKEGEILDVLSDLILGKIDESKALNIFWDDLRIESGIATDLIYDIKESILDKKKDIEEIKQNLKKDILGSFSPQIIVDEFSKGINFSFNDPIVKKRYDDAILSWLRDVRKDADLKEVLTRSTKIGGVGMDENTYNKLAVLLVQKKQQIAQENINMPQIVNAYESKQGGNSDVIESEIDVESKVKRPTLQTSDTQDIHINQLLQERGIGFGELASKEKIKRELGDTERVPEVSGDFAKEIIEEEEFLQSKPEIAQKFTKPAAQLLQREEIRQPAPKVEIKQPIIRRTDTQNRPKMEDVRMESSTKLYGPIEELGALSIMDFRRLSKDPAEAALKIIGKLDLLEDESLIKRMQGVKALKSSPLYKTYAEIMNQAMASGKSIETTVNEKNIITLPEFKAIMGLNQNLKY